MPSPCPKRLLSASPRHSSWSLGPNSPISWQLEERGSTLCLSTPWMDKGIKRRQPGRPWATARTRCTLKEGRGLEMSSLPQLPGCHLQLFCSKSCRAEGQPGLFVPFIFWRHRSEGRPQRTLGTHAQRLCSGVRNPGFRFQFSTFSFAVLGRAPGSICTMEVNGASHLHHCVLKRIKEHFRKVLVNT